ncbi:unnamed protein product [Orchesella dallaii]|uniref:Long-chain-fatty-acid--CoA ligase n=2 Tax=Orchesella dallaii TaxID=48710 RepID=A0ABP1QBK9_9HEXA
MGDIMDVLLTPTVVFCSVLTVLFLALVIVFRKFFYIVLVTSPRDIKGAVRYAQVLVWLWIEKLRNRNVGQVFDSIVAKYPNKVCFYFEDQQWTFRQVDDLTNRVANYFLKQGFRKGDSVALFMENRPEYVCMCLGLSKIGAIPALINYNLRLKPLQHSFEVADCKALIYGYELQEAVSEVSKEGGFTGTLLYCSGHKGNPLLEFSIDLDKGLKDVLGTPPLVKEPVGFNDKLYYIFTSGTTGLPKAAIIKHSRFFMAVYGGHYMHGLSHNDIQYTALPLYHTVGGVLGIGQALFFGTSSVLRKKFSASSFWKDCIKYEVTVAQYIGEICRYLICQPPTEFDRMHKVRLMYGNGLRAEIWEKFVDRFGIPHIGELYGSTEGNTNLVNIDGKVGAVGFLPVWGLRILPMVLVKVDETGEIVRDEKTGLCIRTKANEVGELLGKIVSRNPLRDFQGYADESAKQKKILRSVFRKGDKYFRSGDVLRMDDYGYFYFKDRTGDTFRWKGENVSTAEVESVISSMCGLKDAVVYGVEIPGSEGRAGMAAIADPEGNIDLSTLAEGLAKQLPAYARPLFVRILKQIDMTGTYKLRKLDLQKEGFDVHHITDNVYYYTGSKYIPLDTTLYQMIMSGQMRL